MIERREAANPRRRNPEPKTGETAAGPQPAEVSSEERMIRALETIAKALKMQADGTHRNAAALERHADAMAQIAAANVKCVSLCEGLIRQFGTIPTRFF